MKNKKKKNGFTLPELIAVIVLLVIISLIAINTIKGVLNKANETIDKDKEKQIINAAEKWAVENSSKFDDTEAVNMSVGADIVFILDFSGSMAFKSNFIQTPSGKVSRFQAMIEALDSSLKVLMPKESANKVAIVSYKYEVNTILNLDKYTTTGSNYVQWQKYSSYNDDFGTISFPTLYNSNNVKITQTYRMSNGVTFTQGGILGAEKILLNNNDVNNRIPVIILFTDGLPSAYSASDNFDSYCNYCHGDWDLNAAFYAIRAGVKAKKSVEKHYSNSKVFFYTVGLGITSGSEGELVLNPTKTNIEATTSNYNRKSLANKLINDNGSSAYSYADKSFINVLDTEQLQFAFSNIATEVVEATKVTQMCVSTEDLYKEGYLSNKDAKLSDGSAISEYVLISMNEATNQYVYTIARTDDQKKQCKELLDKSSK